jgi:hypothetical protein
VSVVVLNRSGTINITKLSKSMITRKGIENCKCKFCEKQISLGDDILSKRSRNHKLYHLKCAKKINVI